MSQLTLLSFMESQRDYVFKKIRLYTLVSNAMNSKNKKVLEKDVKQVIVLVFLRPLTKDERNQIKKRLKLMLDTRSDTLIAQKSMFIMLLTRKRSIYELFKIREILKNVGLAYNYHYKMFAGKVYPYEEGIKKGIFLINGW